jgi:3-methylfumaryl-CoA hydratase
VSAETPSAPPTASSTSTSTADLGDWRPAPQHALDVVTPAAAAGLHGLLDSPGDPPGEGDPLPPLWHWMAFLPRVPQAELGADGHPRVGAFLPPVPFPRRMFAGGRLEFGGPARVGEPLERESRVTSVEEKHGRSGALMFVTVRHEIRAGGQVAITEQQDLVYRGEAGGGGGATPGAAPAEAEEQWEWDWSLPIEPTLLFRFSALTYNAHRIHYDRPYATTVEGYPGLVVHGPLQAVTLAELCRRHRSDRPLRAFRFRAVSPAFDDGPIRLRGRTDAGGAEVTLRASDHHGATTMQSSATLADTVA